jgi:hypothetical protein
MHERRHHQIIDLSTFAKPIDEQPRHFMVSIVDDDVRDDWLINGWALLRYTTPIALVVLLGLLLKAVLR